MKCRVCNTNSSFFHKRDFRTFYICPACYLIFTFDIPDNKFQVEHYQAQWESTDPSFWKEQVNSLLNIFERHNASGKILDFGSGAGEITTELSRRGFDVTPVDPITTGHLKSQNFSEKFNIVVALEVIEHLPNLWEEMDEISKILTEHGIMICSTNLTNSFIEKKNAKSLFTNWWYKNDLTHVSFFCNKTVSVLAEMGNYSSVDIYEDIAFVLNR